MEKKMYFENPTQVVWVDEDNHAHAGIAYGDVIICGCCGGTQEIAEIYEFAPEGVENPITELEWTSIREEIGGDYLYEEEVDG
jgi:hypothetical protein